MIHKLFVVGEVVETLVFHIKLKQWKSLLEFVVIGIYKQQNYKCVYNDLDEWWYIGFLGTTFF